jgi:hypothetical protein
VLVADTDKAAVQELVYAAAFPRRVKQSHAPQPKLRQKGLARTIGFAGLARLATALARPKTCAQFTTDSIKLQIPNTLDDACEGVQRR